MAQGSLIMTDTQRNRILDMMDRLDDLFSRIESIERRLDAIERLDLTTKGTK